MASPEFTPENKLELHMPHGFYASIDPYAARVESFRLGETDLIAPYDADRARGGILPYLPLFDANCMGEVTELEQPWQIMEGTDPNRISLSHEIAFDECDPQAGRRMELDICIRPVSVDQVSLTMVLQVTNNGFYSFNFAPALCSGFLIEPDRSAEDIVFEATAPDLQEYKQFTAAQLAVVQSLGPIAHGAERFYNNGFEVSVIPNKLPHLVVWTDDAASFICLAPTAEGLDLSSAAGYTLGLGDVRTYSMQVNWERKAPKASTVPFEVAVANLLGNQALSAAA